MNVEEFEQPSLLVQMVLGGHFREFEQHSLWEFHIMISYHMARRTLDIKQIVSSNTSLSNNLIDMYVNKIK